MFSFRYSWFEGVGFRGRDGSGDICYVFYRVVVVTFLGGKLF